MKLYTQKRLSRSVLMFHLLIAGVLLLAACQPITDTRSAQPADAAAPAATATPAAEAVEEEATPEPTEEPAEEPVAEATPEPTEEPAEEPVAEATPEPTEEPAAEATPAPTEEPAEEDTAEDVADEPADDSDSPSSDAADAEILLEPATATITTRSLRVREAPDADSEVVAGAREGESYPVIAISTDGAWVQIEIDRAEDGVGWVSTNFISLEGDITETATAPVIAPEATPTPTTSLFELTGPTATVDTRSLVVRAEPEDEAEVVAGLALGDVYDVLGISPDGVWLQLALPEVVGGAGWVQATFVRLAGDLTAIPTIGEVEEEVDETGEETTEAEAGDDAGDDVPAGVPTEFTTATVNTRSLFVRAEPVAGSDPVAGAREGEVYNVLEISEDGQWVRIETARSETGEGWVAAEFVTLE